jgi:hypothetical protein
MERWELWILVTPYIHPYKVSLYFLKLQITPERFPDLVYSYAIINNFMYSQWFLITMPIIPLTLFVEIFWEVAKTHTLKRNVFFLQMKPWDQQTWCLSEDIFSGNHEDTFQIFPYCQNKAQIWKINLVECITSFVWNVTLGN